MTVEGTAEIVIREEMGYKVHDEIKIDCIGCNKPAISLLIVKRGEEYPDWQFQVKCRKCGQTSFRYRILCSKIYYTAISPYGLCGTDVDLEKGLTLLEVK